VIYDFVFCNAVLGGTLLGGGSGCMHSDSGKGEGLAEENGIAMNAGFVHKRVVEWREKSCGNLNAG
jgi:hypothetical protein